MGLILAVLGTIGSEIFNYSRGIYLISRVLGGDLPDCFYVGSKSRKFAPKKLIFAYFLQGYAFAVKGGLTQRYIGL